MPNHRVRKQLKWLPRDVPGKTSDERGPGQPGDDQVKTD